MGWKWRAFRESMEPTSQPLHKTPSHGSAPAKSSVKPTSPGWEGKAVPPSIPWGFSGPFIHSCTKPLQTDVPTTKTPLPKIHRWLPITSRTETRLVLLTSLPGLKSLHELILPTSSLNTTPQPNRTIFVCLHTSHHCTPPCLWSSWSLCLEHSLPPPEPDELLQASKQKPPPPGSLP